MPYPVTFEADYAERQSRLTAFFRLLLAIPILIWVAIYGFFGSIAIVVAWFVVVITARYPEGLYEFVAGYTRLLARATAYTVLLCDPYPPFGGGDDPSYPIRMQFAGPLPQYSRLKAFFRFLLAIPILIARYAIGILMEIGAIAAWVTIVLLGRMPYGLWEVMVLANSFTARSDAYIYLLTETYPPFSDEPSLPAGTRQQVTDRRDLPGTGGQQPADRRDLPQAGTQQPADPPDLPGTGGQPPTERPEQPD